MTENLIPSLTISLIALTVIFLVLTILIFTIKLLVHFIPYQEPPAPPAKPRAPAASAPAGEIDEHVAAITGAMTAYLGKSPSEVQITQIKSL